MKSSLYLTIIAAIAALTIPVLAQTTFVEVQNEVGINFTHELDGTCPGPPVGSGSAWADYDNDGDIDFYITNHGGASRLFRNDGDSNADGLPDFTDVAPALGVDEVDQISHGVVFADYDNDGDQDLYITHWGGNTLYQNRLIETGSIEFLDVTAVAGVGDADRCLTAAWGDFDQDGWLDLYLAKHFDCMPNTRESRDALFKNNGDGTFTNVSQYLCADHTLTCPQLNNSHAFSAGWFDMDNDNDLDLYIVSDVVAAGWPNILWRNDGPDGTGGWTFTDISVESGTNLNANCKGLGIGDYDNDGYLDLAFSQAEGGTLLHNEGDGTFTDVSEVAGIRRPLTPLHDATVDWATMFFDYDNDGWLDLFRVSGMISGLTTPQPDVLFRNNGDGTFEDVSVAAGVDDDRRGRSASICDFDQDGFVDLFVGNFGTSVDLWHNESAILGNTNHWLTVTAEGVFNNRDGIGTRFYLTTPDGITQIREITRGPTHGGGDCKAAYFGMGINTSGELSVRWPGDVVEDLGAVTADQHLHVFEVVNSATETDPLVSQFQLSQNYPNPFNPTTVISYQLTAISQVNLAVYDLLGLEIATLVNEKLAPGTYATEWDATGYPSGVYFYTLSVAGFVQTRKLVLLR